MAKEIDSKKFDKLVSVLNKDGFGLSETHYCNATGIERPQIARYLYAAELKADPKLKVAQTAKAVAEARDKKGLRWPRIAVYSGLSESKVKELYTEATGNDPTTSYTGRGRKWDPDATSVSSGTSGRRSGSTSGSKSKTKSATSGRRTKAASKAGSKTASAPGSRRPGRRTSRASATADPK